jgi:pyridoxal 5'-phosphate synthase pdxS subunit
MALKTGLAEMLKGWVIMDITTVAGGIATPADASLMMQLGAAAVFMGAGIFKLGDPARRAQAIVQAVTHYLDADLLARISEDLREPMVGIDITRLELGELLQTQGW